MPKISIIIPIYNTEKYLMECIDSILCQSFTDIEVILVNDGSPGNADEICQKYVNLDKRIKYFYKKNEGVAIARNFGISKATGDYIYCIDSDDTINQNLIKDIYVSFKETECDLLIIVSQWNNKKIDNIFCLPTWGFAVKKEILDKYPDVRFPDGLQPCEDCIFSHKLLALTDKKAKLNTDGYYYRNHLESSEHNINIDKLFVDIPKWLDSLQEFYDKYDLFKTHKFFLLSFIKVEPFARLNSFKFSLFQKMYLSKVIKSFILKNQLMENVNTEKFNQRFQNFLNSKSYLGYLFKNNYAKNIRKLFSIQNEYSSGIKRKVIMILGVKIKIKCCSNNKKTPKEISGKQVG